MESLLNYFTGRAVELGAAAAKIIDMKSVITAAWVGNKCRFGCTNYNKSGCCPPHTPGYKEMQEILDCYKSAILVHCKDFRQPTKIVTVLEQEAFLSGYQKAFALGSGPCRLCKECNPEVCNFPLTARPSMEACGIDVYTTARDNGYHIQVLHNGGCEQNCFGLLLVE